VVHKTGVLHRDIKPANIYVREGDGGLVLLDFGAARDASGGTSRSLTSIVTPGYAPFEQYHTHGAQGPWSDLYAFGGVLYWLVTGNKPVEAPSRVRDDSMPSAETAAAGRYSSALLRAIDWALTPDERDRPKCVAEFKAALTGQVEVSGREFVPRAAPAPPAGIASRKASTTRIVEIYAVGVVVAALVAVAGYAILTPRAPTPPAAASPQTSVAAIPAADPAAGSTGVPRANQPEKGADAGRGAVPRNRAAAVSKGVAPKEAAIAAAPVLATEAPASAEARASRADDPVAYLVFDVAPRGEVVVDGRKVGTAPPLSKLKLAPGKHKIEVHGSMPPYIYYYTVRLDANENKRVWAKFANEGY
jgi:hypothetical protein